MCLLNDFLHNYTTLFDFFLRWKAEPEQSKPPTLVYCMLTGSSGWVSLSIWAIFNRSVSVPIFITSEYFQAPLKRSVFTHFLFCFFLGYVFSFLKVFPIPQSTFLLQFFIASPISTRILCFL